MNAADLISEKAAWIELHSSIRDAETEMRTQHTQGLLVRDSAGRAVGVLSRADLDAFYRSLAAPHAHAAPEQEQIERWVSPGIISVPDDAPLRRVIRDMLRHRIHRIFVTSREGDTYKGVITIMDILRNVLRRRYFPVFVLGLVMSAAFTRAASEMPAPRWGLLPQSTLTLSGDSSLHKYHSQAMRLEGVVELDPAAGGMDVADQIERGAVRRFELTVPVESLQSGKKQLDRNMNNALNAKAHPAITYRMSRYSVAAGTDAAKYIEAPGTLSVAGQSKEVVLRARLKADAGRAQITGEQELLMTDFGVKPPVMMMGALKTHNRVVIHYDIVIGPIQGQ